MIRVIKGTVKADGENYTPGDVITGLSKKDEQSLVKARMAEPWGASSEDPHEADGETAVEDELETSTSGDGQDKEPGIENDCRGKSESETEGHPQEEEAENHSEESVAAGSIDIRFDPESYVAQPATNPETKPAVKKGKGRSDK